MPNDVKRTKMIHIYTPDGGDYRIEVERETRRTYENGDTISTQDGNLLVQRKLASIASQPVPGGPVLISTYDDLRVLLSNCGHALAAEEEQIEAARLATLNPDEP